MSKFQVGQIWRTHSGQHARIVAIEPQVPDWPIVMRKLEPTDQSSYVLDANGQSEHHVTGNEDDLIELISKS